MAKLIINQNQEFELRDDVTTIGRAEDNNIVVPERIVSRKHARIQQKDNEFVFYDTSLNGIRVNGEKINQRVLKDGDEIVIGSTVLRFCQTEESNKTVVVKPSLSPLLIADKKIPQKKQHGLLLLVAIITIIIILGGAVAFLARKPVPDDVKKAPLVSSVIKPRATTQTVPANTKKAMELISQAEAELKMAERFYRERNLQLGNLYNSITKRRDASGKLAIISPSPLLYEEVSAKLKAEEKELDEKITQENNTAYFYYQKGDYSSLLEHIYNILQLIPDANDPRNKKAKERILKYEK